MIFMSSYSNPPSPGRSAGGHVLHRQGHRSPGQHRAAPPLRHHHLRDHWARVLRWGAQQNLLWHHGLEYVVFVSIKISVIYQFIIVIMNKQSISKVIVLFHFRCNSNRGGLRNTMRWRSQGNGPHGILHLQVVITIAVSPVSNILHATTSADNF